MEIILRDEKTKKSYANKKIKKKQELLHSRHNSIFHFFLKKSILKK